jgi:hypothetical protein
MSSFELQQLQRPNYVNPIPQQVIQTPVSSIQKSSSSSYMWLKLLGMFIIIGIVIYIIWAIHSAFSGLLNEILNTGKTFFQAVDCTLEKLNCCVNGCPGSGTLCSASQIKTIKNNSGCNVCSSCSPPCYLPSFKGGISCTEWAFIGLGGLFAGLLTKLYKRVKRNATEETMDDADLAELEATNSDVLDYLDVTQKDNLLDDADFKFFDIDKSDENAKTEIRKFTKVDPDNLQESDIPESVKKKFNLEGDALVKRCQKRLNQRNKARKSMTKHATKKKLQSERGPSNKELNERLETDLKQIEDEWKKPDKKSGNSDDTDDDYNDDVNDDFIEPVE